MTHHRKDNPKMPTITITKTPKPGPTGYDVSASEAQKVKDFNTKIRYVEGFRFTIPGNSQTPFNVVPAAPGKFCLGVSMNLVTGSDLSDTTVSLIINNNNILNDCAVNNLVPQLVQGMLFFPTPNPLSGNDKITFNFNKSNAGTVFLYCNFFYLPQ